MAVDFSNVGSEMEQRCGVYVNSRCITCVTRRKEMERTISNILFDVTLFTSLINDRVKKQVRHPLLLDHKMRTLSFVFELQCKVSENVTNSGRCTRLLRLLVKMKRIECMGTSFSCKHSVRWITRNLCTCRVLSVSRFRRLSMFTCYKCRTLHLNAIHSCSYSREQKRT